MRVSVLQDQLARALGIVSKAVDSRSTLQVLGNVILATEDSRLRLAATNLEMSITTYIGANVEMDGSITLPAKTLAEFVNTLTPGYSVELELNPQTQTVHVQSGMTQSNIKGIASAEFPLIPEVGDPDLMLPGGMLKSMIDQTVFSTAKDDNRPILTGVYTELNGDKLTMAAADGYRLAVRTATMEQRFKEKRTMVVPAKSLAEVARIITDDNAQIAIQLPQGDRNLALFTIGETVISTQLLEGRFPDFGAIIPKSYSTSIMMDTQDLLRACKRSEIFARDNSYSARIRVTPAKGSSEPGEVTITGKSDQRGDQQGQVDANIEGEAIEVAFNIKYLIEALSVIDEANVVIQSSGEKQPGVLRPQDRDDFIYVVMPMSVIR